MGTFLSKIGISEDSEMAFIFEHLYESINRNKMELDEYIENYIGRGNHVDVFDYFREEFSEEIAKKILNANNDGKKVWIGKLNSDYDEYETFFCTDSFVIDNEEIYINGANCIW